MANKAPHNQKTNLWDVQLLERLILLVEELNQSAGELAMCAEADFRSRMLPLKYCEKHLRQLNVANGNSRVGSKPDWLDPMRANLNTGYATLIKALVQIQFYDRLQQQLAHIQQTYPAISEQLQALLQTKGNPTTLSIDYLYALPEIIRLHMAQLVSTRELFQAELSEWKKQVRLAEEQVHGLLSMEGINQKEDAQPIHESVVRIRFVVPEIVRQLQSLQEDDGGFLHFEAVSFNVQTMLGELASEVGTLPMSPDEKSTSQVLTRIRSRYTMQSERGLHDSIFSEKRNPESNRPPEIHNQDIELF